MMDFAQLEARETCGSALMQSGRHSLMLHSERFLLLGSSGLG